MSVGSEIRAARVRQKLSLDALAFLAGMSVGYLSRLENDRANPTWATLKRLAESLSSRPAFYLLPAGDSTTPSAADLAAMTPLDRLYSQELKVYEALQMLRWGAQVGLEYAVVGDVAALLQGLPVPLRTMQVLVVDTDDSLQGLEELLLAAGLLFREVGPDRLRTWPVRTWAFGSAVSTAVTIELVPSLPPTTVIDLDGLDLRLATPAELLRDPVIAELTRAEG